MVKEKTLRGCWAILLILFFPCLGFSQEYVENRIWVRLSYEISEQRLIELDNSHASKEFWQGLLGLDFESNYSIQKIDRPFPLAGGEMGMPLRYVFEILLLACDERQNLMSRLISCGEVQLVENIPLDKIDAIPDDPEYVNQWSLDKIKADLAWDISTGSFDVVVAVVDKAINIGHEDLQAAIWVNDQEIPSNGIDDDGNGFVDDYYGWDAADEDGDPTPPANLNVWEHGSFVSGVVGAVTDNATGIASIGNGVRVMSIKATPDASSSGVPYAFDGVYYAVVNNADVINCSWSSSFYSLVGQDMMNWAFAEGSIVVASASNQGNNMDVIANKRYPACYDNVICVANTKNDDVKKGNSNYGNDIDVSAPGTSILSTTNGNNYEIKGGTSASAPLVSGLVGLVKSYSPYHSNQTIIDCVLNAAQNIDAENPSYVGLLGTGRIDAYEAMLCISALPIPPPEAGISANFLSIPEGNTIIFSDSSQNDPTSWLWNFDLNQIGSTSLTTANGIGSHAVTFYSSGTYTVQLEVDNSNGSDVTTIIVEVYSTAFQEILDAESVKIYPNPLMERFTIDWIGPFTFEVLNNFGKKIIFGLSEGYQIIDLKKEAAGVYFLKIYDEEGNLTRVEKLIKL